MIQTYTRIEDIWKHQLNDVREAKTSIFFEQYIVENFEMDEIGRLFVDALIEKAKEGLVVRCIFDAQGTFSLFSNGELCRQLTDAGAKILFYKTLRKIRKHNPVRLILRDHRKFLVIDNTITWIGGAVIGERFRGWSDLMVRFTNLDIAEVASKEFKKQLLRLQDRRTLLAPLERVNEYYHFSGNAPGINNRFCYEEICHAIMLAQTSVVLVSPYFAPPYKLFRIIRRRLKEGLSITLVTPKITNHTLADIVRERYLYVFFSYGLQVEYVPHMLHAKAVMADTHWVTFGSANLDALSLIYNHELNLVSTDKDCVKEIAGAIDTYRASATRATAEDSLYPHFSIWKKILSFVGKYFV